ncbi:MAG TPA: hypothetical protein EYP61_07600, partial [Candidatus Latescibacteria bacterium]|nr:hypothetical protein [Candidatus Latescibacterota bacterium]
MRVSRRRHWVLGLVALGLGAFLTASLLSWSSGDLTLPPGQVRNWGGVLGVKLAGLGYGLLGYGIWLMPVLAFAWGWRLLRGLPLRGTMLRSAGWLAVVVVLDVLAARLSPDLGGKAGRVLSSRVFL